LQLVLKEFEGRGERTTAERVGIFYDVGCTYGSARHEILVLGRLCNVRTVVASRHAPSTSVPPILYVGDPDYRREAGRGRRKRRRPTHPHMCMQVATCNRGRTRTQGQEDSVRFAGVPVSYKSIENLCFFLSLLP